MVHLSERPTVCQEVLRSADFLDPAALNGLLSEIALYLLLYSEGSNMRHFPEGMWFFYWAMAHSPHMEAIWQGGFPRAIQGARDRRASIRNLQQVSSTEAA